MGPYSNPAEPQSVSWTHLLYFVLITTPLLLNVSLMIPVVSRATQPYQATDNYILKMFWIPEELGQQLFDCKAAD